MPDDPLLNDPLLGSVPEHEGYKVLGGVMLHEKLGQGGMGAVYRGRHSRLDVHVAVKVMLPPPDLSADRKAVMAKRFLREARLAARVNHPNLIRITDVNSEGDALYLVMDYVDGESAAQRLIRNGPLSEIEAVQICLGAARGLAAAHKAGIVHRDVKPDNILIDKSDHVIVADLGVAKSFEGDDEDRSMLTQTQQAMGTPAYMAPEQFESARNVGPPAAVWSLGVTLYQLVSGELPWQDSSVFGLARKIMDHPLPDIRERRSDVSDGLYAILLKALHEEALEKKPSSRYADCGEMAQALAVHMTSLRAPKDKTPAPPPKSATVVSSPVTPVIDDLVIVGRTSQIDSRARQPESPSASTPQTVAQLSRQPLAEPTLADQQEGLKVSPIPWIVCSLAVMVGIGIGGWLLFSGPDRHSQVNGLLKQAQELRETEKLGEAKEKLTEALAILPEHPKVKRLLGRVEVLIQAKHLLEQLDDQIKRKEERREASYQKWMDEGRRFYRHGELSNAALAYDQAVEFAPPDSTMAARLAKWSRRDLYLKKGEAAERKGDLESALTFYKEAKDHGAAADDRIRSVQAKKFFDRGTAKFKADDYAGAIRDLDKAIELKPNDAQAYCLRGDVLYSKDDYAGAIRDFDRAIELKTNYAEAYRSRGSALHMKGDYNGAIRDYDRAIELKPNDAFAYTVRGLAKRRLGDNNGEIRDLDEAITLKPNFAEAYYNRGAAKSRQGDYAGAIRDFDKAIKLRPSFWLYYTGRGSAKRRKRDYDGAIRDYDKAIKLEPDDAGAYFSANAYYWRGVAKDGKGDYDGAIRDFEKTLQLKPDHPKARRGLADAYYWRGVAKGKKRDYDGAIRDYDKAIRLEPDAGFYYYARGNTKNDMRDYDGAIRDFDKAIQLKPNYAEAYYWRGWAKSDKRDYAGAIRDYGKVIELKPNYAKAYYRRGWAKSDKRDYDGAIRDFDKAIQLKPDYAAAYYWRGWAKGEKGDHVGAESDTDRARRLGYTGGKAITPPQPAQNPAPKWAKERSQWRKLRKGMTKRQVTALIGKPTRFSVKTLDLTDSQKAALAGLGTQARLAALNSMPRKQVEVWYYKVSDAKTIGIVTLSKITRPASGFRYPSSTGRTVESWIEPTWESRNKLNIR